MQDGASQFASSGQHRGPGSSSSKERWLWRPPRPTAHLKIRDTPIDSLQCSCEPNKVGEVEAVIHQLEAASADAGQQWREECRGIGRESSRRRRADSIDGRGSAQTPVWRAVTRRVN